MTQWFAYEQKDWKNAMVFRRIRAMMKEGKTDEEIANILKAEIAEESIEEAAIKAAKTYSKELKKQIRARMEADMEEIKEKFEIDTAITPIYDLYFKTIKEELQHFV